MLLLLLRCIIISYYYSYHTIVICYRSPFLSEYSIVQDLLVKACSRSLEPLPIPVSVMVYRCIVSLLVLPWIHITDESQVHVNVITGIHVHVHVNVTKRIHTCTCKWNNTNACMCNYFPIAVLVVGMF